MKHWTKDEQEAFHKAWSKMVAKAWHDPAFKHRLMKEPHEVLKESGVKIPHGTEFKVCENTDAVIHLILPIKPEGELTEIMLKNIAAGTCVGGGGGYTAGPSSCAGCAGCNACR